MRTRIRLVCLVLVFAVLSAAALPFPTRTAGTDPSEISDGRSAQRYVLMAYRGKIGVFQGTADTPLRVLNVYLKALPAIDQQMLRIGIHAEGETALQALIEDFES